jgi:hypothetical protein
MSATEAILIVVAIFAATFSLSAYMIEEKRK